MGYTLLLKTTCYSFYWVLDIICLWSICLSDEKKCFLQTPSTDLFKIFSTAKVRINCYIFVCTHPQFYVFNIGRGNWKVDKRQQWRLGKKFCLVSFITAMNYGYKIKSESQVIQHTTMPLTGQIRDW